MKQRGKKKKRTKRNEDNLRNLQDSVKRFNIRIRAVPEEEDKKKDHEKMLEEIIVKNFPKLSQVFSHSLSFGLLLLGHL